MSRQAELTANLNKTSKESSRTCQRLSAVSTANPRPSALNPKPLTRIPNPDKDILLGYDLLNGHLASAISRAGVLKIRAAGSRVLGLTRFRVLLFRVSALEFWVGLGWWARSNALHCLTCCTLTRKGLSRRSHKVWGGASTARFNARPQSLGHLQVGSYRYRSLIEGLYAL